MPSSRFLIAKMLRNIDFNKAKVIVEYGAGNGIFTREILNNMHDDAILLCFEINKEFINQLKKISDKRLIITNQSAEHILTILESYQLEEVDYFISSLPLAIMPLVLTNAILINSKKALKTNGLFLQYQYSLNFFKQFKLIFNKKNVVLSFELLNLPPAFIYKCIK